MTWRTRLLDAVGVRRHRRPAIEVLDLRLEANGALRRGHPPGGWRCRACGAHAVSAVTWPGQHAGWYCARHVPHHAAS